MIDFYNRLRQDKISIIAEVKRASPLAGVLVQDFDIDKICKAYQSGGATAFSVLTDQKFFLGHNDYLQYIYHTFDLPILRKDFIIDPYQIEESYLLGADAILLIVSVLTANQIETLQNLAFGFGMSVLVEVHNADELSIAKDCRAKMIGVNNRNLVDFSVDIKTSLNLSASIPQDVVSVSESGINSQSQITLLKQANFDAVLVGSSLVSDADIAGKLKHLLEKA